MINFVHDFLSSMGQLIRPVETIYFIPEFYSSSCTASISFTKSCITERSSLQYN
jgi:hypothetical protein